MAKPKITRIKAGETSVKMEEDQAAITRKKVVVKDKKLDAAKAKEARRAEKQVKSAEKTKNPFVALWRYLKESWQEIRQVRWPSRKATFKMVLAVLVYTALFVLIISLLDLFFRWLSGLILG